MPESPQLQGNPGGLSLCDYMARRVGIYPRLPLHVLLHCLLRVRVVHGDACSVSVGGFPSWPASRRRR
jgi:hypothetical protein